MKKAILFLITLYASVPVLIYVFPWILGHVIYSHLVRVPLFVDLDRPEAVLNHTCNFYLSPEEGVTLGVWHTLPASQWEKAAGRGPEWYRGTLGDGSPVILYLHGNLGTRALFHRVELVKVLSAAGYHVLSFDYRGFGDSSGDPSEAGMTTDALHLYQWAKEHSSGSLLCLWGHSLGTGVATNAALKVQEQGSLVDAVILEAAYTNIGEVVVGHTIKDDNMIPYHMGQKLHQVSLDTQKERNAESQVQMVSYSQTLGYAHNYIYMDPNLSSVVGGFLLNRKR